MYQILYQFYFIFVPSSSFFNQRILNDIFTHPDSDNELCMLWVYNILLIVNKTTIYMQFLMNHCLIYFLLTQKKLYKWWYIYVLPLYDSTDIGVLSFSSESMSKSPNWYDYDTTRSLWNSIFIFNNRKRNNKFLKRM